MYNVSKKEMANDQFYNLFLILLTASFGIFQNEISIFVSLKFPHFIALKLMITFNTNNIGFSKKPKKKKKLKGAKIREDK
jgi:hypothetical protein